MTTTAQPRVTPATAEDFAILDEHFASAKAQSVTIQPVTLIKSDLYPRASAPVMEAELASRRLESVTPWYPLVGHREGLRANDLVTLASAFWILAMEGGTAHATDRLWSSANH